jgi:hypothetical protein
MYFSSNVDEIKSELYYIIKHVKSVNSASKINEVCYLINNIKQVEIEINDKDIETNFKYLSSLVNKVKHEIHVNQV